jgi:hypothetical protein
MLPGLPERVGDNAHHFTGRTWLLPRVLDWLCEGEERVLLLTGGPGTGKSMIAAWLGGEGPLPDDSENCAGLQLVREQVSAVHFCQAATGAAAPKALADNLARQLAAKVAPFADAVVDSLGARANVEIHVEQLVGEAQEVVAIKTQQLSLDLGELGDEPSFNRALRDPLKRLYERGHRAPMLLVVDALDEAIPYPTRSIPELLAALGDLPSAVRVLATTRPDPAVLYLFPAAAEIDLIADAPPAGDDVRTYVRARLGLPAAADRETLGERLAQKADGNFLYAHLVLEDLLPRLPQAGDFDALPLPADLGDLYQGFLNRRIGVNRTRWRDDVRPVLGLVAVSQGEGLSRAQLDGVTGKDTEGTLEEWKQYLVGALPDGPFRPFHKSFADFLLDEPRNDAYRVDAAGMHKRLVDHYWPAAPDDAPGADPAVAGNGAKAWAGWDAYARRYLPTHLAGAARGLPSAKGHPFVERLVGLVTDVDYQDEYRVDVKDLAALQGDLDQTMRAAAADLDPMALVLLAQAAFALVDFRRRELRPEPLFELARTGDVDAAAARLDLFEADQRWRETAMFALGWLGADNNPQQARRALDRLHGLTGPWWRLAAHLRAALGGQPVPPAQLEPPEPDLAHELVKRAEGQGANTELLQHHGHGATVQDTRGLTTVGYIAEKDAPVLVALAAANPASGDALFGRYLATLAGYSYVEYRNQSLWFLLVEALKHPDPAWVKAMTARIAATALSPAGADFREGMWITVLALRTVDGDVPLQHEFDRYAGQTYAMAKAMKPSPHHDSRYSDTYGSIKRRLATFAQCFATLLGQPADAAQLLDKAIAIGDLGFAGFQMPACLSLAESAEVCVPGLAMTPEKALEVARTAAHNVQDETFCARSTARYNAMRRGWWNPPAGWAPGVDLVAAGRRLSDDGGGAEFAALHVVGESYEGRRPGGLPRPETAHTADSLARLAELYHRPLADLLRLNHGNGWQAETSLPDGTEVRIPDRGLAPLLAARFAAAVLADPALDAVPRIEAIQALVPVAAANPTALDTVLGRLLLAARPADTARLGALLDLAEKARSTGTTASTSSPFHPGSPG